MRPDRGRRVFDLVVGASSIYGGSWLEGAGAVYAENQALRWIADLAGLPAAAGGVFVPGGTVGNLSALVAARHTARARALRRARGAGARPYRIAATDSAHSSVDSMAAVMDAEVCGVAGRRELRLTGDRLREALLEEHGPRRFFAVVATSGTTNFGSSTTSTSVAEVCREFGLWLHVDGAYGGAGLAAPSVRHLYEGIEHADSFIVDPHKWLFAPFDCCALIYRDPALARAAHTQEASATSTSSRGAGVEPDRLLRRPDPPGPRAAVLVLPRRRTAPTPTSRRSRATLEVTRFAAAEIAPPRLPRGGARARPVGRRLPPARLDAGGLPGVDRPAARPRSSPSSCRPRTTARR